MRRTLAGTAVAVLASATLLAGCAESEPEDPAIDDPQVTIEDTEEATEEPTSDDMSTMEDMATMEDMESTDS